MLHLGVLQVKKRRLLRNVGWAALLMLALAFVGLAARRFRIPLFEPNYAKNFAWTVARERGLVFQTAAVYRDEGLSGCIYSRQRPNTFWGIPFQFANGFHVEIRYSVSLRQLCWKFSAPPVQQVARLMPAPQPSIVREAELVVGRPAAAYGVPIQEVTVDLDPLMLERTHWTSSLEPNLLPFNRLMFPVSVPDRSAPGGLRILSRTEPLRQAAAASYRSLLWFLAFGGLACLGYLWFSYRRLRFCYSRFCGNRISPSVFRLGRDTNAAAYKDLRSLTPTFWGFLRSPDLAALEASSLQEIFRFAGVSPAAGRSVRLALPAETLRLAPPRPQKTPKDYGRQISALLRYIRLRDLSGIPVLEDLLEEALCLEEPKAKRHALQAVLNWIHEHERLAREATLQAAAPTLEEQTLDASCFELTVDETVESPAVVADELPNVPELVPVTVLQETPSVVIARDHLDWGDMSTVLPGSLPDIHRVTAWALLSQLLVGAHGNPAFGRGRLIHVRALQQGTVRFLKGEYGQERKIISTFYRVANWLEGEGVLLVEHSTGQTCYSINNKPREATLLGRPIVELCVRSDRENADRHS